MSDMLDLQQPLLEGGIRSVNFFNGRLLTGKDLGREQAARRQAEWRLGQAIGEGVAFGLEVEEAAAISTPAAPAIKIHAGAAINRSGQTLRLIDDTAVTLVRRSSAAASENRIFNVCEKIAGGSYVAGAGVYLLTLAPAEATEGKAPTNGLDPLNVRCNTDAIVEAVQFRLLEIPPTQYAALAKTSPKFRNQLAYLCFGAQHMADFCADPFGLELAQYGLIDDLHKTQLSDCDVPLALIYWTSAGIGFVENWAVRRRLTRRATAGRWSPLLDERRASEGEAMFHQFQAQIDDMRNATTNLSEVTATQYFDCLPPLGLLPITSGAAQPGFNPDKFFSGLTTRGPAFIEGAKMGALLRSSFAYPPLDLASGELVWLYRVRENRQALDAKLARPVQEYLIFASGHMPYFADARFDAARWDYSNYALG